MTRAFDFIYWHFQSIIWAYILKSQNSSAHGPRLPHLTSPCMLSEILGCLLSATMQQWPSDVASPSCSEPTSRCSREMSDQAPLLGVTMEEVFNDDLRSTSKTQLYGGVVDGSFVTKQFKSYYSTC